MFKSYVIFSLFLVPCIIESVEVDKTEKANKTRDEYGIINWENDSH